VRRATYAKVSPKISGNRISIPTALIAAWGVLLTAGAGGVTFDADSLTDADIQTVAGRLRSDHGTQFDGQAEALLQAQNKTEGSALYGAFADVKPTDEQDIDFAQRYFNPIRTLAMVYSSKGSRYFRNSEVAKAMHNGLIYTRKHVYAGCDKPGNWWVWGKQMPGCLADIMTAVYEDLAPEDQAYLLAVMDYLVPRAPIADEGYHHGKSGRDALAMLKVGAATRDRERIAYAWEGMENAVATYFLEPDGAPLMTVIRAEWLGISLPYVYEGYRTLVEWIEITQGTAMAPRNETSGKIGEYLLGLGRWNTFQGTEMAWIAFVTYRTFWRPASTLSMARAMAGLDVPHAEELRAMAAGTDTPPDGVRFWPSIETLIYRAPDFYCALPMASKNKHGVSWAYKNKFLHIGNKWYYGRDGHTILASQPEDHDPNLTYTFNWRRLSGITRDDGSVLDSPQKGGRTEGYWQPQHILCENPIAGAAVLDERQAVAGIEVCSGQLRARKSYYFLHDQNLIVTQGDRIKGRGQTDTIVHTFPIGDDAPAQLIVNGETVALAEGRSHIVPTPAWVAGPRGGYYFPEDGAVTLLTETREPDFEDHGEWTQEQKAKVPAQQFISIFFDHGENPANAEYVSAHWPAATPESIERLAEAFARDASFRRETAGHFLSYGSYTGIAFFEPGTIHGYSADRPCFLTAREDDEALRMALFEPSWRNVTLTLGLPFEAVAKTLPNGYRLDGSTFTADVKTGQPVTLHFTENAAGQRTLESVTTPDWQLHAKGMAMLPKPRHEDFELYPVGRPPDNALVLTSGVQDAIVVTDESPASGSRCVRITDGAPALPFYEPELVYDLRFDKGTVLLSYDVRLERGAILRNDLRNRRTIHGVGPSLVFERGKLLIAERELMAVPEGQWFHVEVEVALGDKAAGTFDLAVTLPGQAPRRFTALPCQRADFVEAYRCFFSAYGTEPSAFYLDNIHIEQR